MAVVQQTQEAVQRVPTALQAEVLDFVEYLLVKAEREALGEEELAWTGFSLATAIREMEDDETPLYALSDLKVVC